MGIRLDWEIETEKTRLRASGEDPDAARKRRAARFRLLLTIVLLLTLISGAGLFVLYRINETNATIERLLRDTVTAEITALRLNDWQAFASLQRSASPTWIEEQRTLFEEYERLILRNENVQLTGHIRDLTIDDLRARVHVEEIVDGVPYERIWFYWRYELDEDNDGFVDNWRHVPPDYEFWGADRTLESANVTVDYMAVDAAFATAVSERLQEWVGIACNAINCDQLPTIQVLIRPDGVPRMAWAQENPWVLQMRSPYADRARADIPFSPELQIEAASILAERLVQHTLDGTSPIYPADAYYIRQAVISWLVGRFVLIDTQSFMIASIAENYGEETIGQLLRIMPPDADISIISEVTGVPLDQSNIDWRDFFSWRLSLESELVARQDTQNFLMLYDTGDETVLNTAYQRANTLSSGQRVATMVQATDPTEAGIPQRVVSVRITEEDGTTREDTATFRLRDNVWLRAN